MRWPYCSGSSDLTGRMSRHQFVAFLEMINGMFGGMLDGDDVTDEEGGESKGLDSAPPAIAEGNGYLQGRDHRSASEHALAVQADVLWETLAMHTPGGSEASDSASITSGPASRPTSPDPVSPPPEGGGGGGGGTAGTSGGGGGDGSPSDDSGDGSSGGGGGGGGGGSRRLMHVDSLESAMEYEAARAAAESLASLDDVVLDGGSGGGGGGGGDMDGDDEDGDGEFILCEQFLRVALVQPLIGECLSLQAAGSRPSLTKGILSSGSFASPQHAAATAGQRQPQTRQDANGAGTKESRSNGDGETKIVHL